MLAPRGAGVGLLSLRRARFAASRLYPLSRARSDRLSRPSLFRSLRVAFPCPHRRRPKRWPRARCIYWTDFVLRRRAHPPVAYPRRCPLAICHSPFVNSSLLPSPLRPPLSLFSRVFLVCVFVSFCLLTLPFVSIYLEHFDEPASDTSWPSHINLAPSSLNIQRFNIDVTNEKPTLY